MANVIINEEHLTNIANAIRSKKGTQNNMYPRDMASEISTISTGVDTFDATATETSLLQGSTAYAKGKKITGIMPNIGIQEIEIYDKSYDISISSGYHNGYGHAKIAETEKSKLIPENIRSGVDILGVRGNLQENAGGIDTSDATTISSDILYRKTAYAKGLKLTGTMTDVGLQEIEISNASQTYNIQEGYHNGFGSAKISSSERDKLIPENIRDGVNILGVTGSLQTAGVGKQIKTGFTSNPSFSTGLSTIDKLIMYANEIKGTGVVNVIYEGGTFCTLTFCGEYSIYMSACKVKKSYDFGINRGIFDWKGQASQACAFQSGVTYSWIAVGS